MFDEHTIHMWSMANSFFFTTSRAFSYVFSTATFQTLKKTIDYDFYWYQSFNNWVIIGRVKPLVNWIEPSHPCLQHPSSKDILQRNNHSFTCWISNWTVIYRLSSQQTWFYKMTYLLPMSHIAYQKWVQWSKVINKHNHNFKRISNFLKIFNK